MRGSKGPDGKSATGGVGEPGPKGLPGSIGRTGPQGPRGSFYLFICKSHVHIN